MSEGWDDVEPVGGPDDDELEDDTGTWDEPEDDDAEDDDAEDDDA